ncbi:hypothetical protein M728_002368 [Ensifer sp. WSM1721]|uniref:ASCH domain-containing protein n=1 Tax=Ensifer sp. WSM1721 TaxID=1041159 RepID=UPI000686FDB3
MRQEIRLASQFIPLINSGLKTTTVRMGKRDYKVGPADLITGNVRIPIVIEEVFFCRLSELTEQDARMDGFSHRDQLVSTLKSFYPQIESNSPVTVVRFFRA